MFHDAAHTDLLVAEPNSAGGRARNVQQVTHQARQLPHLTLNDGQGLFLNGVPAFLELKQLHGIEDGGKRIAKFMAEHSQELVFTAIQLGQFLLRLFAFGNVNDCRTAEFPLPLVVLGGNALDQRMHRLPVSEELDLAGLSGVGRQHPVAEISKRWTVFDGYELPEPPLDHGASIQA